MPRLTSDRATGAVVAYALLACGPKAVCTLWKYWSPDYMSGSGVLGVLSHGLVVCWFVVVGLALISLFVAKTKWWLIAVMACVPMVCATWRAIGIWTDSEFGKLPSIWAMGYEARNLLCDCSMVWFCYLALKRTANPVGRTEGHEASGDSAGAKSMAVAVDPPGGPPPVLSYEYVRADVGLQLFLARVTTVYSGLVIATVYLTMIAFWVCGQFPSGRGVLRLYGGEVGYVVSLLAGLWAWRVWTSRDRQTSPANTSKWLVGALLLAGLLHATEMSRGILMAASGLMVLDAFAERYPASISVAVFVYWLSRPQSGNARRTF